MKENHLPDATRDPSRWGKWLLAVGLLFVAVQGTYHLYGIRSFFAPGVYHATELNLINKDSIKIEHTLKDLEVLLNKLQRLSSTPGQAVPNPSGALASVSLPDEPRHPDPAWGDTLFWAKKKRVNVARKLNYISVVLKSMQRSLEAQLSDSGRASTPKPEIEHNLQQIRENLANLRKYGDRLDELSEELKKLEGHGPSNSTKIVSDMGNK